MYILILILLLNGVAYCQSSNVWNRITPLKSSRADVEKILGKPEPWSVARHAARYKTNNGNVDVIYSTGLCDTDPKAGWNIPELTVISIDVYPNRPPTFSKLKIDRSRFERHPDPGAIDSDYYTNEKDGIVLTVDTRSDTVTRFSYFPESKYDHLMCKNIKKESKISKPTD